MSNTSEEESKYLVTGMAVVASTPKKRRNPPGNPDPDAEVIALSPRTLLATNRYICEVCHKGFQRDQNLQLHRRGHNLPWKLKQRSNEAKKRVYVCPEASCAHHDPTRALGDLTGIKKHYSRKHGDKKWKCDKCAKRYAVQSDWKAHSKICGTKEYRCDCGTIFARKDSFVTHRAFCDALKEENYMSNHGLPPMAANMYSQPQSMFSRTMPSCGSSIMEPGSDFKSLLHNPSMLMNPDSVFNNGSFGISNAQPSGGYSFMPSTAILQQATEMGNNAQSCLLRGSKGAGDGSGFGETSSVLFPVGGESRAFCVQRRDGGGEIGGRSGRMTKDFLGLGGSGSVSASSSGNVNYVENEFYGCQQMSHGTTTPFEKNVWQ